MKVASIIDNNLAFPHGNRKGLSYGELAVLLLTYIVSEADHRICCVEKRKITEMICHREFLYLADSKASTYENRAIFALFTTWLRARIERLFLSTLYGASLYNLFE